MDNFSHLNIYNNKKILLIFTVQSFAKNDYLCKFMIFRLKVKTDTDHYFFSLADILAFGSKSFNTIDSVDTVMCYLLYGIANALDLLHTNDSLFSYIN